VTMDKSPFARHCRNAEGYQQQNFGFLRLL